VWRIQIEEIRFFSKYVNRMLKYAKLQFYSNFLKSIKTIKIRKSNKNVLHLNKTFLQ